MADGDWITLRIWREKCVSFIINIFVRFRFHPPPLILSIYLGIVALQSDRLTNASRKLEILRLSMKVNTSGHYILSRMVPHCPRISRRDVYYILDPIMLRVIKTFWITYLNITNWFMDFHDSSLSLDFCFGAISGQLAASTFSLLKDTDKKKVLWAGSCSGNRCHRFSKCVV